MTAYKTIFSSTFVLIAAAADGQPVMMDSLPPSVDFSTVLGPGIVALGADTATHGDFDRDGLGDLAFCSPKRILSLFIGD